MYIRPRTIALSITILALGTGRLRGMAPDTDGTVKGSKEETPD